MNSLEAGRLGELIPVASYARTSEDFRQRDGHGVRHQLRINERIAHEHGCIVVAAYSDNGCSASKGSSVWRTIGCIAALMIWRGSSPH